MDKGGYLDSWKDIAAYLKRNVRTCQTWERELGLPIHRLDDSPRARVFAYTAELDAWRDEKGQVPGNGEVRSDDGKSTSLPPPTKSITIRGPAKTWMAAALFGGLAVTAVAMGLILWHLRPAPTPAVGRFAIEVEPGAHPPKKQVMIVDGVEVVTNPAAPLHRDPGRVLKVEERLRIRDVPYAFYFKSPQLPEIAPDGSVLLRDLDQQLLRFSAEGAFLGNIIKPGQGPGEIQMLYGYLIEDDHIYVTDGAGNKIVHMTLDGRYLEERKVDADFATMTRGWLVSLRSVEPQTQGLLAMAEHNFSWISRWDDTFRGTYTFLGWYYRKAGFHFAWDEPHWVADAGSDQLFVSLSRDYAIKVLDLDAGRIIRSFNRTYPGVPLVLTEYMKEFYEQGGMPRPDFEPDVLELFLVDRSLWVRTSTVDPKKGQLFDVFSLSGEFLDSFFVPFKGKILGVRGDTIFVQEIQTAGPVAVVLYRNLEYGKD